MSGELTKLSETRWRYATARRVFYVKQLKAPNEDTGEPGRFVVDAGGEDRSLVLAASLEHLLLDIRHGTHSSPRDGA